jgi:lysyl-tRNA synthetase class 2
MLSAAASGAAARPFLTHHNALSEDLYLRISPETFLKRLVAGGLDRVYELGRNFRNEGMDASHLPEFTMLEWYAAYWNYRDNMALVRELVLVLLDDVIGRRVLDVDGREIDFGAEWPVLDYREAVFAATGIDLRVVRSLTDLRSALAGNAWGVDPSAPSYASLVDQLYKRVLRPTLVRPCFLIGHPAELVPLARRCDEDPAKLDMFQVVVGGWEIVKAYSELVDPAEQRLRLEEQAALKAAGDDETMIIEEDFLEAMEHGMPPMSGLGLGIDRIVAILTQAHTLRDTVLFPALRTDEGVQVAPDADGGGPAAERRLR